MTSGNLIAQTETILKYCVLGLLIVFALATLFAFVINWETWFFGTKLDGFPAGIALGATWLVAALLAAALIKFPRMEPVTRGIDGGLFWIPVCQFIHDDPKSVVHSPGFFTGSGGIPDPFNCFLHCRFNKEISGELQKTPVKPSDCPPQKIQPIKTPHLPK